MEIDEEEEFWKCRKHPSQAWSGVCPSCLRDRLLLLCPNCANLRPCPCFPSPYSSSSSSSSFSLRFLSDPPRSSSVGSVGRVSSLIEIEPALRRSRSAAFAFLRPRMDDRNNNRAAHRLEPKGMSRFGKFWGILKGRSSSSGIDQNRILERSRSVGDGFGGLKEKKWSFPSPMRVFRLKKSARVVHGRSPMCRGW